MPQVSHLCVIEDLKTRIHCLVTSGNIWASTMHFLLGQWVSQRESVWMGASTAGWAPASHHMAHTSEVSAFTGIASPSSSPALPCPLHLPCS